MGEIEERKQRSESLIQPLALPINPWLPTDLTSEQCRLRPSDEVVDRILALCFLIAKGHDAPEDVLKYLDKKYGSRLKLTPKERTFVNQTKPHERDRVHATWQYEAAWALCWAVGLVDELSFPPKIADIEALPKLINPMEEREVKQAARCRSVDEILDQQDLMARIAWACRELSLTDQHAPSVDCDVVWERLRAFRWLTDPEEADWEDVSLDA